MALLFAGCAAGAAQSGGGTSGASGSVANQPAYAGQFDKNRIMTFEIAADPEDWQALLDNATDKEYIKADITINGTTVENVGIRAKGNSSLSSVARDADSDRYSFKVKFDEYVDGQTWMGLDKLVLNGNYADSTSMKEYLSYDIMSFIGVATPLYAYADIVVNGESWGFYLAIEDMDSGYRDRVYGGEGELYKPDNDMGLGGEDFIQRGDMPEGMELPEGFAPPDGTAPAEGESGTDAVAGGQGAPPSGLPKGDFTPPEGMEPPEGFTMPEGVDGRGMGGGMMGMAGNGVSLQYTDDDEASYSAIFDNDKSKTDAADHQRVITALKNISEGNELEKYIDVDATLRYFAAHTVVVNLDSYTGSMGHNYLLYESDGQLTMLPWDYNLAFGGFMSGDASSVVNFPIDTPVSGISIEDRPLLAKLLEVPEYLERYHGYLQQIIDGYFANDQFEAKVAELDALIGSHIESDPAPFYTYEEYKAAIAELAKLGTLRGESIQGQLDGGIPATTEGQQAEPDKLVDASLVDMSALGGQGGGQGGSFGGQPPNGGGWGGQPPDGGSQPAGETGQ